jgi:hypothetical protein
MPTVVPGDYVLNVFTVGYHLLRQSFHLDAMAVKEFEVILTPDTLRQTDKVEVQAAPFETIHQDSPSTLTLEGNDAKNLGSVLADDPLRAVQNLPGVSSNNDFDARFSLRGADFSRIPVPAPCAESEPGPRGGSCHLSTPSPALLQAHSCSVTETLQYGNSGRISRRLKSCDPLVGP